MLPSPSDPTGSVRFGASATHHCLGVLARVARFGKARSVAMNRANIGAISLTGSLIGWLPFVREDLGVGDEVLGTDGDLHRFVVVESA